MTDTSQLETALDSDQQQVGTLYAKALLGSAGDAADGVVAELEAVVRECLTPHPLLEQALASPRITQEQKEAMLDRIFNGRIDGRLLNFLKILCRRGRIGSLRAIQVQTTALRQEQLGKRRVIVTSAQPLSDDQRAQLVHRLRETYNIDAVLVERVDASLLGGITLRIGDQVIDGSAQGKLQSLQTALTSGMQKAIRESYQTLLTN